MDKANTFDEPQFCALCNVRLPNKKVADDHFNGQLHRQNAERTKKKEQNAERGIFIRRDDIGNITDEELVNLFKQYGEVIQIRRPGGANRPFCIVKFVDSASVQRALSQQHYMKGRPLNCTPEKTFGATSNMKLTTNVPPKPVKKQHPAASQNYELVNLEELPVTTNMSFEDAVKEFIKKIEAEPGLERKYEIVCTDLENTFSKELPGVKARLFGSTITGLAFKGSDLDIFMECLGGQPGRNFIARKADLMFKVGLFKNIIKISHARVPVIKFVHIRTGIACDVTFISKLGVMNSHLIRFLLSLDVRLRPLLMVIKYWGRVHEITGVGKFSNYAFVILVIFYLQQIGGPVLPSVKFLQDISPKKDYCLHSQMKWECSFSHDKSKVPLSKDKIPLRQLLSGFFDFYSEFEFKNYIISPYIGKLIDVDCFKTANADLSRLPEDVVDLIVRMKGFPSEAKFVTDVPVCIQDPFDLSFNITKCITDKLCNRFKWLCNYAKDYVFDVQTINADVLKLLFNIPGIEESSVLSSPERLVKSVPITSIDLPNTTENYRLTEDYKMNWFKCIKDAILLVFEEIYKFKMLPNDETTRLAKVKQVKNLHDIAYKNFSYRCHGDAPIFHSRKKSEKQLFLTKVTCLEREVKISEYIVSHNKEPAIFLADVHVLCYPNLSPPALTISMVDVCKEKFNIFKGFSSWIQCNIENHCKIAIKYNESSKSYDNQWQNQNKMDISSSSEKLNGIQPSSGNVNPINVIQPSENITNDTNLSDVRDNGIRKKKEVEKQEPVYNLRRRRKNHRCPRRYPYVKNNPNDKPNPGDLLLQAIEKPLTEEDWDN